MNIHQEQKNGSFVACDNDGRRVIIEWHKTTILSPELASFKKEMSDLAAQVSAVSEIQFLKLFPEAVSRDGFLKGCQPLFAQGVEHVDWLAVEQKTQESIKQFYRADLSLFGQQIIDKLIKDVYFFASVKDQESLQLLGFAMSSITPALPAGDIKLINLIISSQAQGEGLEKLLLGSLMSVLPDVKRIFTLVRPTDGNALQVLAECGFAEDKNPLQDPHHPIDPQQFIVLEYKTNQSDVLQKTFELLTE